MPLEEWRDIVGSVAVVATVLQFLSVSRCVVSYWVFMFRLHRHHTTPHTAKPLVCKQYVVNRTTSESSPLPFIFGLTSCSLWLEYGLMKHDDKIVIVNTIGGSLYFAYTVVFYIFTIKKSSVLKQFCIGVAFLVFVITYSSYEIDSQLLLKRLGLLACSLSLMFVAAPLTKLLHVLKLKNTECLPFPMIIMAFIVSLLWLMYGVITEDPYLQMPNLIGSMLAAFQLSLFLVYPTRPTSPLSKSLLA